MIRRDDESVDYRNNRQDGSYLAEFLLDKGYEVFGMVAVSTGF